MIGKQTCILALCFCIELYFNTCCRLIIEVWMNDETSLGWTRYTPRFIYLLFVMLFVETMLYFVLNIV
ncbi:hypothetical protein HanRHA438_Chr11g0525241 [Helianthus annuus]|nr:hypothetical protein HanRHA438_Chr11g0525241 [Helianthus annuus]